MATGLYAAVGDERKPGSRPIVRGAQTRQRVSGRKSRNGGPGAIASRGQGARRRTLLCCRIPPTCPLVPSEVHTPGAAVHRPSFRFPSLLRYPLISRRWLSGSISVRSASLSFVRPSVRPRTDPLALSCDRLAIFSIHARSTFLPSPTRVRSSPLFLPFRSPLLQVSAPRRP